MNTAFSLSYFVLSTRSLAQRELVRFYRQKSRMAGVIGSPLVFWFLIGSGLSGSFRHPSAPPEMNYLEYFFPGTIVLIILFTAIFSTMSIIEDRKEGFLQSVIVAPVPRASIAMGKLLGGTALALLQAVMLLVLTPFLGIALDAWSILAVLVTLFSIAFGLTGLGFLIAWKMDSTQGFHAVMNLFLIPLWLLSGSLFPASGAAGWLGVAMQANPLTYGVAALRQALYLHGHTGTADLAPLAVNLGVTVAFALVMFAGSTYLVNQRARS
jgi:ABC-2 type transport system permease protein